MSSAEEKQPGQSAPRPPLAERGESSLPPHLRPSVAGVPVTPGISPSTYKADNDNNANSDNNNHSDNNANANNDNNANSNNSNQPPGPSSSGTTPGYFSAPPAGEPAPQSGGSPPGQASSPAAPPTTSQESVLRRGSLATMSSPSSLSDLQAAFPSLSLTGNIISATFNLPYSLRYHRGGEWELKARRGQSALFDSLSYLSSDETPWNHTVVAWTGEIQEAADDPAPHQPPDPASTTTIGISSLNSLSAPVPIDGQHPVPPPAPPHGEGLWIPREDQLRLERQLSHDKGIRTVPVWLADDHDGGDDGVRLRDQPRWRRYAEHELYTLFHYKQHEPTDGRRERIQWADYYRTNQKFAAKVLEVYRPGDVVVVHDYYLMLLPSMLRQRAPHMSIAFFLHTPFPSSEFFRCLPRRKEILEGVLGAHLVGFQAYSYSRHFASCCTRVLGFPSDTTGVEAYGARVEVGVFPIGIDAQKVARLAFDDGVTAKCAALRQMYEGKKIIVGRDRLDSVRGVAQKLMAFERFLEAYPRWRERVVLIQVTSPTSIEEEKEENKVASRVNELVMKINGLYGSLGFVPVQHYPQYLTQDEYLALLRAADIGLITSVRDGMNTTSLEYVVAQRDTAGPLIISEFSGTAGSLRDAIHINPWDTSGVARAINRALTMPEEERRAMQDHLTAHVTTRTVRSWIDSFLYHLVRVLGGGGGGGGGGDGSSRSGGAAAVVTPLLDRAALLRQYRAAEKRLFMFDYDGTLTPIVREPSAAIPSERVIRTLRALAADHRNAVWIISGRDQEFLSQHLGHIRELGFSAEHGSFIRHPGTTEWQNLTEDMDMGWQGEVLEVFQKYTDRVPGSFIERKRCALTWHYRLADPEQGVHMARACQEELESTTARRWDVEVMTGKANLEVRPRFINKGEIAKRLVANYNADMQHLEDSSAARQPGGKIGFVLCMGDDFTDEDMFRALEGLTSDDGSGSGQPALDAERCFTVTVGASTKATLARWHLLDPEDVVTCVALLAGVGAGGSGATRGGALSMGEVNLAALSAVEGHIPENVK